MVVEDALAETTDLSTVDDPFDPDIGGDGDTRLAASALANAAANSNVSLQATNDIRFEAALNIANPGVTLTAIAGNNILVSNDILFPAGGNVIFEAVNDIELDGTDLQLWTYGGNVSLTAGNTLTLNNAAWVDTAPDTGDSGNLTINSQTITVNNGSLLNTRTYPGGIGDAGDIQISTNQLLMENDAQISASTFGIGDGGVIEINAADRIQLDSGDIGSSAVGGDGNAGEIQIFTRQLFMQNGAQVGTGTFSSGDGGLLTVNATDQIQLSGASTGLFGQAASGSSGNAGDVNIVTNQLLIQDDADVSVATFGSGNGGNLKVNADDLIQLNGNGTLLTGRAGSGSSGNAGVIEILANRLLIQDDAQVDVTTFGEGDGGTLTVEVADVIKISGESRLTGLFSRAASSSLGDAGDIQLTADQISIQNGAIASGSGGLGSGGDIAIQANRIEVIGADSGISSTSNNSLSTASIGNVLLDVDEILLRDGGTVNARSLGAADAGNIEIVNASSVQLSGAGTGLRASANNVTADATAGLIRIDADTILVQDEAQLNERSFGGAEAGTNANHEASFVVFQDQKDAGYVEFRNQNDESSTTEFTGAFVTTGLGTGNGGRVSIDADRLNFSGVFTGIQVDGTAVSNSGVVEITSSEVTLENEANILSLGALGRIQIVAEDFLEITDAAIALVSLSAFYPGVSSLDVGDLRMSDFGYISAGIGFTAVNSEAVQEAFGIDISDVLAVLAAFSELNPDSISSGGQIDVSADNVLLENQSQIISFGGDVDISSNTVSLRNESAVNVLSPLASGGRISVQADEALNLQNQSAILASAGPLGEEDGRGGAVSLDAPYIALSDLSFITASAFSGGGGNVNIQADNFLLLRLNSLISASTGIAGNDGGDGGNVTIASPFVLGVLSENSDIIANAVAGDGGLVTITALDIIGLEFQDQLTPFSDITASSDLGLAGITEFNRLTDINVEEGLNELPVDLVDPNDLVSQQCALQASDRASEFTVVGRGGLPPDPSQPGTAGLFLEDLGTVLPDVTPVLDEARSNAPDELEPLTTIQEAQGWLQDVDGRIYLISATDDDSLAVPPAAVFCSNRPHA